MFAKLKQELQLFTEVAFEVAGSVCFIIMALLVHGLVVVLWEGVFSGPAPRSLTICLVLAALFVTHYRRARRKGRRKQGGR